jgi:hypothetical protein
LPCDWKKFDQNAASLRVHLLKIEAGVWKDARYGEIADVKRHELKQPAREARLSLRQSPR